MPVQTDDDDDDGYDVDICRILILSVIMQLFFLFPLSLPYSCALLACIHNTPVLLHWYLNDCKDADKKCCCICLNMLSCCGLKFTCSVYLNMLCCYSKVMEQPHCVAMINVCSVDKVKILCIVLHLFLISSVAVVKSLQSYVAMVKL